MGSELDFTWGYNGPSKVKQCAPNLTLQVDSELELWNKVMKEVSLGRYAGPYQEIPFKYYIQSPIGLVPKDNGKSTRMIFHLSYPKGSDGTSVNDNILHELCKVKYPDFSDAIRLCIQISGKWGRTGIYFKIRCISGF